MITNIAIALGVMMIPIGFLMMTDENISRWWIYFVGIVGFGCLIWAAIRANQEDKKKDRQYEEFLTELRGLRGDIKQSINNTDKASKP